MNEQHQPFPHPQAAKPFTYNNGRTAISDFHPRRQLTPIQGLVFALFLGTLIWLGIFWLSNQF